MGFYLRLFQQGEDSVNQIKDDALNPYYQFSFNKDWKSPSIFFIALNDFL